MTGGQGWALLGLVGVLMSVIGGLIMNQFHLLRAFLDARFETGDVRFASVDARFDAMDRRFDGLDRRFDSLDRDIQALTAVFFRRE